MKKIPIVLACDNKFSIGLGFAIQSLLSNIRENTFYEIYVLDGGISNKNKKKIKSLKKINDNFSILFINMEAESKIFDKIKLDDKRFSKAVYFRLAIPKLFKNKYEKVIFLDCDLAIETDLTKMYSIDLKNNVVAGVPDIGIRYFYNKTKKRIKYYKDIGFTPKTIKKYVNAGVMIWNLKEFVKHKDYENRLIHFFSQHEICYLNDQDAINSIFFGKIKILEPRWNLQVLWDNQEQYRNDLVYIYHFAGNKPWKQAVIMHLPRFPYFDIMSKYFPLSPWKFKINYNIKIKYPLKVIYIKSTNFLLKILKKIIPNQRNKEKINQLIWKRICPD